MHMTPPVMPQTLEYANAHTDKTVTLVAPKAFKIRAEDNSILDIPAGTHEVPEWVGSHWYTAANGASVYVKPSPVAEAAPKPAPKRASKATTVIVDDSVDQAPSASVESTGTATPEA